MMHVLRMASTGLALLLAVSSACAEEDFKPRLQKVVVNGQTLYEVGSKDGAVQLDIDTAKPTKIACTFVNQGDKPGEDPFMVLMHLDGGEKVIGGDYAPSTPTTKWDKDVLIVDEKNVDLAAFKGKQVKFFIGLYRGADRISLINAGLDYQQRLLVGTLYIDRKPSTGHTQDPSPKP